MAADAIKIYPLNKALRVRFSGASVRLPPDIQEKIDTYWQQLVESGKKYTRGEVFTVTEKKEEAGSLNILVEKTDYAHYLYNQNVGGLGRHAVRVIHTAALVLTSDEHILLGEMGQHTSKPGGLHFSAGGIDVADLRGDMFDFDHNIRNELKEELGIDVADAQRVSAFTRAYFKEGGETGKMTVIYRVELTETAAEFFKKYAQFENLLVQSGKPPEFERVAALLAKEEYVKAFLEEYKAKCDEYMPPLFEFLLEQKSAS